MSSTDTLDRITVENKTALEAFSAAESLFSKLQEKIWPKGRAVSRTLTCPTHHGDFHDAILHPDDGFTVALGSFDGAGIPVELVKFGAISTIREAVLHGEGPRSIIERLNQGLWEFNRRVREIPLSGSVFVATLPGEGRVLHYCSAGHVEPFCVTSRRAVVRLGNAGPPLGGSTGLELPEQAVDLGYVTRLICVSEGAIEAKSARGQRFGAQGIQVVLERFPECPIEQQADLVYRALRDHVEGGERLRRDVTLVVADLRDPLSLRATGWLNRRIQSYEAESSGELDTSVFLG
jgi:serine phosphatase RsbU (regulator of sigma subunit)